jgi:hypothetical protein
MELFSYASMLSPPRKAVVDEIDKNEKDRVKRE